MKTSGKYSELLDKFVKEQKKVVTIINSCNSGVQIEAAEKVLNLFRFRTSSVYGKLLVTYPEEITFKVNRTIATFKKLKNQYEYSSVNPSSWNRDSKDSERVQKI